MTGGMERYEIFDLERLRNASAPSDARETEWLRVFRHFHPRLTTYFAGRIQSPDDVDDLLGEIWRKALLGIRSLHSQAAMWAWLITIGNNLLRDEWRRRSRLGARIPLTDAESQQGMRHLIAGWSVGPDEGGDEVDDFLAPFKGLEPQDVELLRLLVAGHNHAEISAALALPSAAASRQRLHRIRERIIAAWEAGRQALPALPSGRTGGAHDTEV